MDITTFIVSFGGAAIFIGSIAIMAAMIVAGIIAGIMGLFALVFFVGILTHVFGEKKVLDFAFVSFPLFGGLFVLGSIVSIVAFVIAFVVIWIFATFLSLLSSGGLGGLVATIGGTFMTIMGFVTTGFLAIVGLAVIVVGLMLTSRFVSWVMKSLFPKKVITPATA